MKPEFQRRVQRYGWDKAAEFYEASWKKQLKPAQDRLLDLAALKPGEKVIETACGTGLITSRVARAVGSGGEVMATDLSDGMIKIAESLAKKKKISNTNFRRMDAEQLDFKNNGYDVALCGLGLMYVPDPVRALKEMYRVLSPGGRAVVAIWGERKNCGWAEIFPVVDKHVASDVCPLFFQQGTSNTLEHSLAAAGFADISLERLSVKLHFDSAEEALMAAFAGGPVALAYQKFDDRIRGQAHEEYLSSITPFQNKSAYDIPGEFVIGRGVKAG